MGRDHDEIAQSSSDRNHDRLWKIVAASVVKGKAGRQAGPARLPRPTQKKKRRMPTKNPKEEAFQSSDRTLPMVTWPSLRL